MNATISLQNIEKIANGFGIPISQLFSDLEGKI